MGLGGIPRKLFELRLNAAAAATGQYNAKAAAWIFSAEFFFCDLKDAYIRLVAVEMLVAIKH